VKNLKRINHLSKQNPFIMISKSGGARMMEAAYSLMQLAKHLYAQQLAEEKHFIPCRPYYWSDCILCLRETSIFLNQAIGLQDLEW
jgi:hypothetical protein